jgi:hypothetical protein
MFAPWLAPSLFTPFNGFWSGAFALYVADGLVMPLMLLLAGLAIVTAGRGWWWLVAALGGAFLGRRLHAARGGGGSAPRGLAARSPGVGTPVGTAG